MSNTYKYDNNEIADKAELVKSVPRDVIRKFLKTYFNNQKNTTVVSMDGINSAMISDFNENNLNKLSLDIIKSYSSFIAEFYNADPKEYDRTLIYESEFKDNTLIIRWI